MINPRVSIILPCRNEEHYIGACLDSLIVNDYPAVSTEILVIDGISNDKTPELIKDYCERNPNIKLFSNPGGTFPCGVNIGILNSTGDLIFIAGAHAIYEKNYISKCVENSIKYKADNVGGVLNTVPENNSLTGKLIVSALSSPFGVGNSKFRTGSTKVVEADTVFGGCYRKEVFSKYGFFNEELVSTSDYEYNRRIKKSGAKIILDPQVVVTYFTRSSLMRFLKNNFRNGFWSVYPIAITDHFPVSLRHLVPLVFLLSLILSLALSFFMNLGLYIFLCVLASYSIVSLVFTIKLFEYKKMGTLLLPFFFFFLHLSYGVGSLAGIFSGVSYKLKHS